MPNYWVEVRMSPHKERRDAVRKAAAEHGAKLHADELFVPLSGKRDRGFALLEVPDDLDEAKAKRLLEALDAKACLVLVGVEEAGRIQAGGKRPAEPSTWS